MQVTLRIDPRIGTKPKPQADPARPGPIPPRRVRPEAAQPEPNPNPKPNPKPKPNQI
jgi:hypothetical protein